MRYLDAKTWVRIWQEAGPRLDAIRLQELQNVDVGNAVRALSDAFEASRRRAEPRLTSGLVEQQRLLQRLAK